MDASTPHFSSDDFLREVEAVAAAEARAAKKLADAAAEAQKIRAKAQAQAVEIATKASEKAVEEKNKLILASRHQTEIKIGQLLNKAGQKSEDFSSRRLGESAVREISDSI